MPDNKYFDKVKLLDGSYAEVYDAVAREAIAGGTRFLGVTTTAISDGASTNPITIGGESVTAKNGDIVVYGNKEFIFASIDSKWHELGDTTGLGALALKDSASTLYTPEGTVSKPNVNVTPTLAGVKQVVNEGSVSSVTIHEFDGAGSVTPGKANTPTAVTLPVFTTTLNGTTLEFGWSAGSVTPGSAGTPTAVTLPTSKETSVVRSATMPTTSTLSVMTGAAAELAAAPVFSGTQSTIIVE